MINKKTFKGEIVALQKGQLLLMPIGFKNGSKKCKLSIELINNARAYCQRRGCLEKIRNLIKGR